MARLKREPLTYFEAMTRLGGRPLRRIAYNTWLVLDGQDIHVRFHDTNILTFHPDGTLTVRTGGYYTVTTKERINRYTRLQVYQKRGDWWYGSHLPFVEGMRVPNHSHRFAYTTYEGIQLTDSGSLLIAADLAADRNDTSMEAQLRSAARQLT